MSSTLVAVFCAAFFVLGCVVGLVLGIELADVIPGDDEVHP